jgi:hypothetical protein
MPKTSAPRFQQRQLVMPMRNAWTADQEARRIAVERGETVVANWKTDAALRDWAEEQGVLVYIGRSMLGFGLGESVWANRTCRVAKAASGEERAACVAAYARALDANLDLLARLPELCGKALLCFCHPLACHGHVLARRANVLAGL